MIGSSAIGATNVTSSSVVSKGSRFRASTMNVPSIVKHSAIPDMSQATRYGSYRLKGLLNMVLANPSLPSSAYVAYKAFG